MFWKLFSSARVYRTNYSLDIEPKHYIMNALYSYRLRHVFTPADEESTFPSCYSCTKTTHRMVCDAQKCHSVGYIL